MDAQDLENHKDRLSEMVGQIAWRVTRLPQEERAGFIWRGLHRGCELYAEHFGDFEPEDAEQLADHLQKWTEETVRMLEIGRDPGIWESVWGSARSPTPSA